MSGRGAVFLDRDGTIIRDLHFIGKPEQVELIPGVAGAIRRLNQRAYPVIVITNQSGIARGYFTREDYERVEARVAALLGEFRARLDATYMCPHHPDFSGPCDCRKPGLKLFRQAAEDHDIDVSRSWFIGDRLRDVSPARGLGGNGILVPTAETAAVEIETARREFSVADSLDAAVSRVIESAR